MEQQAITYMYRRLSRLVIDAHYVMGLPGMSVGHAWLCYSVIAYIVRHDGCSEQCIWGLGRSNRKEVEGCIQKVKNTFLP